MTVKADQNTGAPYRVAALYKFVSVADVTALIARLEATCTQHGILGTVLVAPEGVNGTIAGPPDRLAAAMTAITALPGLEGLNWKESTASHKPFHRMKVRRKREIVTMGIDDIDPAASAGTYVKPKDWNALIARDDVLLVDTRNDYEVAIGSFDGAVDPETKSFREFPAWVARNENKLGAAKKVAMFCTGGIRCEKSTAYLRKLGYGDVYHLEGGILKYLEEIPAEDSMWHGDCFVFDERVAVGHGLIESDHELCRACRRPIDPAGAGHPDYELGVSCPLCMSEFSESDRARFRERQRQVELAEARGAVHIGRRDDV